MINLTFGLLCNGRWRTIAVAKLGGRNAVLSLTAGIVAVIILVLLMNGIFLWRLTRQTRLSLQKNADLVTTDLRQTLSILTAQNKELELARQEAVISNR